MGLSCSNSPDLLQTVLPQVPQTKHGSNFSSSSGSSAFRSQFGILEPTAPGGSMSPSRGSSQLQHRARGLKALLTEFPLFTLLHFTAIVTITVISRITPLYITAGQSWTPSLLCSQSLSGFHCSRLTNLPSHCVSGSCLHWPSRGLHAPSQGLSTQPGPHWRASPLTVSFLSSAYLNFPWI